MKIIRERPSQRRHHRLTARLLVNFDNLEPVSTIDWSLGGLRLPTVPGLSLSAGSQYTVCLTLSFQGYNISFDAEIEILRIDENDGNIAASFVELSERSEDLLKYFSEDLIRGSMGTVADSICRIDVPVTPISTKPTTSHMTETPVRRLPIKTIIMSCLYILIGVSVFSYVGILIYSNFMRLEIASSVVSTHLQTVKMPVDGIVRQINYVQGQTVAQGHRLAIIEDVKLEQKIKTAALDVEISKKNIWQKREKYRIETERMKLYKIVSKTETSIAKAHLASLKEGLRAADAHLIRISKLIKKGVATNSQLDVAKTEQSRLASEVRVAELTLQQNTAMESASDRRHYNHKSFVSDLDMLAVEMEMGYSDLKIAMQKLYQLENTKNNLIMRAPFTGRVAAIYLASDSRLTRNDPLLLLEKTGDTTVTSFLNQSEIMEVGLHDEATVFIPALNRNIPAIVRKIDRSSSYLNKNMTNYTWHDEKERTAAVTLNLQVEGLLASHITAGLPVVVIFKRRVVSDIWASIVSVFKSAQPSRPNYAEHQKI
ncbi:MAG: biotin/lipoyl-binding protein [Sneathiella sp.]|nr:biotin/lipoyl-binding protein [Sneathiella sp.]